MEGRGSHGPAGAAPRKPGDAIVVSGRSWVAGQGADHQSQHQATLGPPPCQRYDPGRRLVHGCLALGHVRRSHGRSSGALWWGGSPGELLVAWQEGLALRPDPRRSGRSSSKGRLKCQHVPLIRSCSRTSSCPWMLPGCARGVRSRMTAWLKGSVYTENACSVRTCGVLTAVGAVFGSNQAVPHRGFPCRRPRQDPEPRSCSSQPVPMNLRCHNGRYRCATDSGGVMRVPRYGDTSSRGVKVAMGA